MQSSQGTMDRVLDVNQQPPYVELYIDVPLMCASLISTRQGMAGRSPAEQVYWCHGVHCTMDDVASSLGPYKVKVISSDTQTCLFAISPDMPSRQQAEVMLQAAQQLRDVLSKMQMPDGSSVAAKVTIHAGKYAGAVVGRGAWTYDLFGDDVQLLLDMNEATSPNCIQLSDAALDLISSTPGQFTPACKVELQGTAHQLHVLRQGTRSAQAQQSPQQSRPPPQQQQQCQEAGGQQQAALEQPAEGTSFAAAGPSQQPHAQQALKSAAPQQAQHPQQQQQQQLQQQTPKVQLLSRARQQHAEIGATAAAAQCAKQGAKWQAPRHSPRPAAGPAATGGHAPVSLGAMQQDLRFSDRALEAVYMQTHSRALLNMDVLFVLLNAAVLLCSLWDSSSSSSSSGRLPGSHGQVLLAACGQWLLLPVALLWLLTSPSSYSKWREALWLGHSLASALNFALLVVLSSLQQRGLLTGTGAGPLGAAAAAAVAAAGPAVMRAALGLHKGSALALLVANLGLKVRFYLHMPSSVFACIVVALTTLWSYSSSSSSGSQGLWGLLQHLLLGWAAPSMLIYLWELEDRLRYVDGLEQQQSSKGAKQSNCKDV